MIDADARQHCAVGIERVHRIETPAQANFQNGRFDPLPREEPQRGQRAVLEVRESELAARGLHHFKRLAQRAVGGFDPGDARALAVAHEVRGRVQPGAVAARAQHRFEQRAARAFAVRAGDGDHRAGELGAHAPVDSGHPVEPERDRLRMLALDELEPVGERSQAMLSW